VWNLIPGFSVKFDRFFLYSLLGAAAFSRFLLLSVPSFLPFACGRLSQEPWEGMEVVCGYMAIDAENTQTCERFCYLFITGNILHFHNIYQ
jgi:hypothetical protein